MIRNSHLIVGGTVLSISILGVYLFRKSKKALEAKDKTTKRESTTNTSEKKEKEPWKLSKGSEGKEVERLQIFLLRNHGWKGAITKVFDEQTERLVQKVFRKKYIDRATYEKYKMAIPIYKQIKNA